jgi:hypothetical protein
MNKLALLATTAVFLTLTIGTVLLRAPTAIAQQAENRVAAQFSTYLIYDSPEDTFTNGKVPGKKEWHAGVGTGVPLPGLTLTLDSALDFDHIMRENLTTTGPPSYVWSFGDVPPGTGRNAYVGFGGLDSSGVVPVTFTPGFDASRSVDKTEFSAPGTQTLTITVTPRDVIEQLGILIFADENDQVNPVITSPTNGGGIELSDDGHKLVINPTNLRLDTTWVISVTIQVTTKVPEVEYLPFVGIGWREALASDTTSGNSLSFPIADMGTWAWSVEDSYEWDWTDELIRQVCWFSYSGKIGERPKSTAPLKGNHVELGFLETCECNLQPWVDSFTDTEVTGMRRWRIGQISNTADETGEPVRGLRVTLDSDVRFDSAIGFGTSLVKMGPPIYEWFYDELVEEPEFKGHAFDASVMLTHGELATFTPGFDVSRSFDKTVFTAPDTQTVTVTFTRRDESFERVLICVNTEADPDLVDAVIIAHSDEWYNEQLSDDHYAEFGETKTGIPVELNIPLTVTVTIQVTPKVPVVEYKPHVHAAPHYLGGKHDYGTVQGSSFSYTNEAGKWTVSAEGDYIWNWSASTSITPGGSVNLMPERGRTPPTLTPAGVSPPSGTPKTDYTFEVTYVCGYHPSYVRVYIDNSACDMGYVSGNYPDGAVFSHTTALRTGRHTYYFEARDISGLIARFPKTGTISLEVAGKGFEFPVWIVAGSIAGVVVIGSVIFFFVRRRRRPWLWAVSVVLLAGLVSLVVFLQQETPMYEDDFSNPASGWETSSSEKFDLYYEDGEYHVLCQADLPFRKCNIGAGQFTDFALEIDARLVSGPDESCYGVVFRFQDIYNLYSFLVWGDGRYQVETWLNDERTMLQGKTKSDFVNQGNNTNHLKVVCRGTQMEVYVNGHHLTTVTDDSFAKGYVGWIAQTTGANAHVAFDNIKVYRVD